MSRLEFYKRLSSSFNEKNGEGDKDRINNVLIKHVVPEMIIDINEIRRIQNEIIPSLIEDVAKINSRMENISDLTTNTTLEHNKIKHTLEELQNRLDYTEKNESIKIMDISSLKVHQKKLNKEMEEFIIKTECDIKQLKNRKVVFTLAEEKQVGELTIKGDDATED
jgi:hypothetical protein